MITVRTGFGTEDMSLSLRGNCVGEGKSARIMLPAVKSYWMSEESKSWNQSPRGHKRNIAIDGSSSGDRGEIRSMWMGRGADGS